MSDNSSGPWTFVTENLKTILVVGGGYVYGVQSGVMDAPNLPSLPIWSELVAMGVIAAVLVGMLAGGKIYDLLPDPPKVYLEVLSEEPEGNEIWELTPDKFEDLTVEDGTLFRWPETKVPVYECLAYDPETNTATAAWRESVPASEVLGRSDVKDALDLMTDIRTSFEKEARIGHAIRRRIGAIIRRLDRERAADQNAALEGHLAPSIGKGPTTDEIIKEEIGDLAPDWLSSDERLKDEQDDPDSFDLLDVDPDALETIEPDGGTVE